MKKYLRLALLVILAHSMIERSYAFELPDSAKLISDSKLSRKNIKVIEPHESTISRHSYVEYTGIPLDELLTHWFENKWKSEGNQIVFLAKDGYRSAISSQKLIKYHAYLAFARSDNKAFKIDNLAQNQQAVELGPYYLIWANLGVKELIDFGAYDWPYQVTRIELQTQDMADKLRPKRISANIESGLQETEKYFLNCHHIRGIGGQKYPLDLIQATCRWQTKDLKSWIDAPSLIKPGTAMPPLNRMLADEQRGKVITQIVNYLQAMKTESSLACAGK